jgi:hypothetical protein
MPQWLSIDTSYAKEDRMKWRRRRQLVEMLAKEAWTLTRGELCC